MHFKFQIPASVISSVGSVNYHHPQQQQHQLIFVSPFSKPGTSNNSTTVQTLPIVLSTSSSTSSINCNNNQQVDGNAKIKMIQQTTNVQHPRLHPKKRKFDLAELEDDVQTTSNNACNNQPETTPQNVKTTQLLEQNRPVGNVQNLNGNGTHIDAAENHNNSTSTAIASNSQQQQQYLKEQQHFTKKPFSCLPSVASTSSSSSTSQHQSAPVDQADLVDLKEWTNHNVLAKRKDIYYPGIIAGSTLPCSVIVAFRHPEGQQQIFQDIFSNGLYDVISDRVPSMKEVNLNFFSIFNMILIFYCLP